MNMNMNNKLNNNIESTNGYLLGIPKPQELSPSASNLMNDLKSQMEKVNGMYSDLINRSQVKQNNFNSFNNNSSISGINQINTNFISSPQKAQGLNTLNNVKQGNTINFANAVNQNSINNKFSSENKINVNNNNIITKPGQNNIFSNFCF